MIIGWEKWTWLSMIVVLGFIPFFTACDRAPEEMVRVPGGEFLMGTDEIDAEEKAMEYGISKPWFEDEHPAHQVKLPTYYIDRYEVSNARYREFVQLTGRHQPSDWVSGRYPEGKDQHPVVQVTWKMPTPSANGRGNVSRPRRNGKRLLEEQREGNSPGGTTLIRPRPTSTIKSAIQPRSDNTRRA